MDQEEIKEYIEMRQRTVESFTESMIRNDKEDFRDDAIKCKKLAMHYQSMVDLAKKLLD